MERRSRGTIKYNVERLTQAVFCLNETNILLQGIGTYRLIEKTYFSNSQVQFSLFWTKSISFAVFNQPCHWSRLNFTSWTEFQYQFSQETTDIVFGDFELANLHCLVGILSNNCRWKVKVEKRLNATEFCFYSPITNSWNCPEIVIEFQLWTSRMTKDL